MDGIVDDSMGGLKTGNMHQTETSIRLHALQHDYAQITELAKTFERLDAQYSKLLEKSEIGPISPLPACNRGSWFCPVVSIIDALITQYIAIKYGANTIYDMGAGDMRLSYWLFSQGFKVVAYESLKEITESSANLFGRPPFEVRNKDYYEDFAELAKEQDTLFVFFGGGNKPPFIPEHGMVIEGYLEIGTTFWRNGEKLLYW